MLLLRLLGNSSANTDAATTVDVRQPTGNDGGAARNAGPTACQSTAPTANGSGADADGSHSVVNDAWSRCQCWDVESAQLNSSCTVAAGHICGTERDWTTARLRPSRHTATATEDHLVR